MALFGNSDANIKAVITAEDRASGTLKKFGYNAGQLGRQLTIGMTAAAGAVTAFGVTSIKAFSESEDLIAQTNAVLKSTKNIAGVTAEEVTKLATAWQTETKYSDEAVRGAENILLTFTGINKNVFPQTLEAVLDISTALHEDLQSAAIQVGKALQDPVLGITALRRVGVNFSDSQKDVIKKLVETNQKGKAQALILKELKTEFGGSAKAAGGTFAGSLAKLKNSFNDLQEQIGSALIKAIQPYMEQVSAYIKNEGPKFQASLTHLITSFLKLGAFVVRHIDVIIALIAAYKTLRITMGIVSLVQGLSAAFTGASAAMGGASLAASALSAGWVGLAAVATVAVGFGVYKLIQHFKNQAKAAFEADQANRHMTEYLGTSNIFVINRIQAEKNLVQARKDLKSATEQHKTAEQTLNDAVKSGKVSENDLWQLQLNALKTTIELKQAKLDLKDANIKLKDATTQLKLSQSGLNKALNGALTIVAGFKAKGDLAVQSIAKLQGQLGQLGKIRTLDTIQGQATTLKNTLQGNYNDAIKLQNTVGGIQLQGSVNPQRTGTPHAAGGPVATGTSYLVGEKGPEMFTPNSNGYITPNEKISTGISNIVVNIGMYAGTEIEKRKIALGIMKAYNEAMGVR